MIAKLVGAGALLFASLIPLLVMWVASGEFSKWLAFGPLVVAAATLFILAFRSERG